MLFLGGNIYKNVWGVGKKYLNIQKMFKVLK